MLRLTSRIRWTSSSVRSLVRRVGSIWASAHTFFALVLPIPYRYVSEIWICFSRGRSTPEMRAIYPCLCLWRGFAAQITRTTPLRRITLHFTQIFLTEARTFTASSRVPGTHENTSTTEHFAPFRAAPRLPLSNSGWGLPGLEGTGADNRAPHGVKDAGGLGRSPARLSGAGSPPGPSCIASAP